MSYALPGIVAAFIGPSICALCECPILDGEFSEGVALLTIDDKIEHSEVHLTCLENAALEFKTETDAYLGEEFEHMNPEYILA